MGLTKTQQGIWQRSRAGGSGAQAVVLTDAVCAYLVTRVAFDLGFAGQFTEAPPGLPEVFGPADPDTLAVPCSNSRALFERLVGLDPDADMYYACLASLHKARLKYEAILQTQAIPTIEQVGPRGLLQFGKLSAKALAGLLFWRKWFFDIDNRAGQETGYLFEPIIAHAVGGTPIPAKRSPVKRHRDPSKGRQVDCLLEQRAYEFKIRVTIAASGQGRWREELDFPVDCRYSGYTPALVVLDSTANPKLSELERAFRAQGGEVYIGESAWQHLASLAGPTMSRFLAKYVRDPLDELIRQAAEELPELVARVEDGSISISIGGEVLRIERRCPAIVEDEGDHIPDDLAENLPGS
jgi:hypothetical protein